MPADLMETILDYLKTCNKDNSNLHLLTILATPSGITYTVISEQGKEEYQSQDLEKVALFLKYYVSWVEPWNSPSMN